MNSLENRMTQPSDPWAAASATPAPAPAQSASPIPFDTGNLFANPSDFGGGSFTPNAPLDSLVGRTLVYIPRTFNPNAPDPFKAGEVRQQWTADVYVIDGGKLSFFYERKADLTATPPRPAEVVEHVHEDCTPETPYVMTNSWVSQAAFVSKLTAASNNRQFLIGTPVRGAQKAQRQAGQTDESVRAAHAAWVARGKQGAEPKFVWLLADVTPEAMARVVQWWNAHKDSIKI
jgi:hypothetical protein